MSKKFSIYEGRFFCHSCKNEVLTARYWKQEVELSWKCKECEEVSVVSLKSPVCRSSKKVSFRWENLGKYHKGANTNFCTVDEAWGRSCESDFLDAVPPGGYPRQTATPRIVEDT